MGAETVGLQLQEIRHAQPANGRDRLVRRIPDRLHVHAVDLRRRHVVAGGLSDQVRVGLRAPQRRTHGVEVVLAQEQDRQLPQLGQIHALVELAFRDGSLAEEAGGHAVALAHLVGQRQADGDRQAAADDRVAAVETPARRRTGAWSRRARGCTLPACRTSRPSRCRQGCRGPAHDRAPGRSRRPHPRRVNAGITPARDGLFPDVQVQEAADLAGAVHFGALLLEAPDANHLPQQGERGVARQASLSGPHSPAWTCRPRADPARAPSTAGA